jgi:hypothetical protein
MATQQPVGGWTNPDPTIPLEARKVFNDSMRCFVGVEYEPVSVATQVVAGMNYRFACDATPLYPGATPYPADVYIYQPLKGDPYIYQILQTKS